TSGIPPSSADRWGRLNRNPNARRRSRVEYVAMGSGDTPRLVATALLAGVAGLLVGSFLNVVVYRAPLGLSVSSPRSFCPNCRHQLSWWENIPVASWVFLRARCRACHQPISARYPLVE